MSMEGPSAGGIGAEDKLCSENSTIGVTVDRHQEGVLMVSYKHGNCLYQGALLQVNPEGGVTSGINFPYPRSSSDNSSQSTNDEVGLDLVECVDQEEEQVQEIEKNEEVGVSTPFIVEIIEASEHETFKEPPSRKSIRKSILTKDLLPPSPRKSVRKSVSMNNSTPKRKSTRLVVKDDLNSSSQFSNAITTEPNIQINDLSSTRKSTAPINDLPSARKSSRKSALKFDLDSSLQHEQKVDEVNREDELSHDQSNEEPKIQENNISVIKSIPLQNKVVVDHDSLANENLTSESESDPISAKAKGISSNMALIQNKFTNEEFNKITSAKVVVKKLESYSGPISGEKGITMALIQGKFTKEEFSKMTSAHVLVKRLEFIPTNKLDQSIQIIENESQVQGIEESKGKMKDIPKKENIVEKSRKVKRNGKKKEKKVKENVSVAEGQDTKILKRTSGIRKLVAAIPSSSKPSSNEKFDETKEKRKRGRLSKIKSIVIKEMLQKKKRKSDEPKESRKRGGSKNDSVEEPSNVIKKRKSVVIEEPKEKRRTRDKEVGVTSPDASKKSKKMDKVKDQVSEEIDKPKEKKKRGALKKEIAVVEQEPSKEKRNVATKKEPEVEPKRKTKDVTNDEVKAGTSKVEKKKSKVEKTKEIENDLEDSQTNSKITRGNKKEIAPSSAASEKQEKKAKRTIEKKPEIVVEIPTETETKKRGAPKKSTVTAVEEPKESRKRGAPKNESITGESSKDKGKNKRNSEVIEEPKEKRSRGAPKKMSF